MHETPEVLWLVLVQDFSDDRWRIKGIFFDRQPAEALEKELKELTEYKQVLVKEVLA